MITCRRPRWSVVAALAATWVLLAAGVATAEGRCSAQRIAGMYAFENRGASTFVLGQAPPRHWSLTSAPLVMAGWINIEEDGTMNGEAWLILGRVTTGLEAQPVSGHLTGLEDCAAVLEWSGTPVPGTPPGFHRERLVFIESGREFRSVLIQSPSASMAWSGRGYRINREVGTCDQHLLRGDVLVQGESLTTSLTPTSPATSASLMRLTVGHDGSYAGTMYYKLPPGYTETTVEGRFTVSPNCMVETQFSSAATPGVTQHGRGMIFDNGRRGFLIMPLATTQPDGSSTPPAWAWAELLPLGPHNGRHE
jgi:hypothetical protein